MNARNFTYTSAQSRSLVIALSAVLLVESTVMHLWIASQHPLIAWTLTATSLATLLWFWHDSVRFARGVIRVDDTSMIIAMGGRWNGTVPRALIVSATRPIWQDVPAAGTDAAKDYANLTRPADPNVLVVLREDVALRLFGLATKNVRRIGCHLDAPDEFVRLITTATT